MEAVYPEIKGHIVAEQSWLTLASKVYEKHSNIVLNVYTDEDWVTKTLIQYNGKEGAHGFYNFKDIAQQTTPRLSSATALRNAVAADDRDLFGQAAGVDPNTLVAGHPFFDVVKHYLMPHAEKAAAKVAKKKVKEPVVELSNELLGRYKKAAGADARRADAEGNYDRGNKRFKGINQATMKQFANDEKDSLKEFSRGDSGDDEGSDDPYKYPEPEHFNRSIDFFGRFEADHFDEEDMNDETGEFKGYWDYDGKLRQIAYFKFDNAKRTGSNHPGMGWYYEPQNEGVAEEGYGNHPSQRVDPRTGKKYVPPKSPLGQGVAEGMAETMPWKEAQKVLNHYGADYFGTSYDKLYFYKYRKQFSIGLIRDEDGNGNHRVNLSDLNAIVRKLRGMRVPLSPFEERVTENAWDRLQREKALESAGVGIITKQNTTVDVNKNTPKKNLKAFRLA
jgi:hypothetical protein